MKLLMTLQTNYPKALALVVELDENAVDLETFEHPRRCVYLLGADERSIESSYRKMPSFGQPKSEKSLNVSVVARIVLYDRGLAKPRS
jgi:tRNA G18 (ribose-2'-O)-methylase SpoU